jgi:2-keto-4-pentenoate hydratase
VSLEIAGYVTPVIEAEIVARIGRDLPQGASEMRIIVSIESLVPGIETADVISHRKTWSWLCQKTFIDRDG